MWLISWVRTEIKSQCNQSSCHSNRGLKLEISENFGGFLLLIESNSWARYANKLVKCLHAEFELLTPQLSQGNKMKTENLCMQLHPWLAGQIPGFLGCL